MNPIVNHSTPVVVLQSGHHGGLGIVRTLGRLGVPVYSVDAGWWEPTLVSRYCRVRFLLDIARESSDFALSKMQQIAHQVGGSPILMPTTDQACLWIAENAADLRQNFRFPAQDPALVRTLCDKSCMQALAHEKGLATARSVTPRSKEDLARFIDGAVFPVMVKETGGGRLRCRAGGTKFLLQTPRELTEFCLRVADFEQPNLILQEFIPGEDWMFNGYFDEHSHCLFGRTGKKVRRFPVNAGVTSLGISAANEALTGTTVGFMRAIGYRGVLDIGYRLDRRDGQYKVLDVNPRVGCTFRLFSAVDGLDVVRACYLDLTGQPVPPAVFAEGRKWLVEDFDFFSALGSWRRCGLSLREWIGSLAGVQELACFALDDPLPFLMMGIADCCEWYRWNRSQAAVGNAQLASASPAPSALQRRY